MYLIVYLISINIVSFLLCLIDKIKSIRDSYRISEKNLMVISFCGGCFGMMLGMNLFRHKTKKLKFKLVYLICFLYFLLIVSLYVKWW